MSDVKKVHRCGKDDLKRVPDRNGMRGAQCNKCFDIWRIEYRNNRVLNVYRNGVRQDVG